jgi:cell division septation protein DedD
MTEDGFREIQLSGKQLVFLFMATTVVAVVIFLCGVMVGRGVRVEKAAAGTDAGSAAAPAAEPATALPAPSATVPPAAATTPPVPASEDLSYYSRLEGGTPPAESLKTPSDKPGAPPSGAATASGGAAGSKQQGASAADRPAPPAARETAAAGGNEAAGDGFAVQIAALADRKEAEAIASRLSGKGYAAYIVDPAPGSAAVYRVRVGKFKNRRDAEDVKRRLEKEEQFKPWIIR